MHDPNSILTEIALLGGAEAPPQQNRSANPQNDGALTGCNFPGPLASDRPRSPQLSSGRQRKRHQSRTIFRIDLLDQLSLQPAPALVHLAAFDLFLGCVHKAEFAHRQRAVFIAHRRSEGPALDRAMRVQVAGSAGRVERRAHLIVRVVLERLFLPIFSEELARRSISREAHRDQPLAARFGACDHSLADVLCRSRKAFAQHGCVQRRDREDSHAALMATRPASQPGTRAFGRGRERRVDHREEWKQGFARRSHVWVSFGQRTAKRASERLSCAGMPALAT